LALVLVVAAAFRLWNLWENEYGNIYYAAAVRSMSANWHNFFYGSFDPAGFITIDKPPVAFWLQALAVRLFGYHGLTLHLPQVIEGMLAVVLVYHLTRRVAGQWGALMAGLVMAVSPANVAVDRSNLLDSYLVLVLFLAAWALLGATQSGSSRWLLLAMGLVGLAFNIKLTAPYVVLPAFYLLYWAAAPVKRWRRLAQLGAATVLLLIISLAWFIILDLTPARSRPYVANTSDNSALSLALGRNGLDKIPALSGPGAQQGPGSKSGPGAKSKAGKGFGKGPGFGMKSKMRKGLKKGPPPDGPYPFAPKEMPPGFQPPGADGPSQLTPPQPYARPRPADAQPSALTAQGGRPGLLRLANRDLAGHIAWFVPLALVGILALALTSRAGLHLPQTALRQTVLLWCGWSATYAAVFSFLEGPVHPYYLALLAPPVAALGGIGLIGLWKAFEHGGWWLALPVAAVALTVLCQWRILYFYPPWKRWLLPLLLAGGIASVIALSLGCMLRRRGTIGHSLGAAGLVLGLLTLLISPAMWAATPALAPGGRMVPLADPVLLDHPVAPGLSEQNRRDVQWLLSMLQKNRHGERFLMAAPDITLAAPLIIESGEAVIAYGGFTGGDSALDAERFAAMVAAGQLRFVMLSGRGARPGLQADIATWVRQHAKEVPPEVWRRAANSSEESAPGGAGWGPTAPMVHRMFHDSAVRLYDCRPEEARP
jgi:4-amino-4-deoxy-L-arabinose transferase-like glycosyltransferase